MNLAIMQPYFFPYLGYFQLVFAADKFVFLDDATYRKGGWINRNWIFQGDTPHRFSVPLECKSSFREIRKTQVHRERFLEWRIKFLATVRHFYRKAPHYSEVNELLRNLLSAEERGISVLASKSIERVCEYLGFRRTFTLASVCHPETRSLKSIDRILAMTRREGARYYINSLGGYELYTPALFHASGVELKFLISKRALPYSRHARAPSIIDLLMWHDREEILVALADFDLV